MLFPLAGEDVSILFRGRFHGGPSDVLRPISSQSNDFLRCSFPSIFSIDGDALTSRKSLSRRTLLLHGSTTCCSTSVTQLELEFPPNNLLSSSERLSASNLDGKMLPFFFDGVGREAFCFQLFHDHVHMLPCSLVNRSCSLFNEDGVHMLPPPSHAFKPKLGCDNHMFLIVKSLLTNNSYAQ